MCWSHWHPPLAGMGLGVITTSPWILCSQGRKRQDHAGERLVAHTTPPHGPMGALALPKYHPPTKTLLWFSVGCVLFPPFLESAIVIWAALSDPSVPPDLFCCVTHPILDILVLHSLFSIPGSPYFSTQAGSAFHPGWP